jgi:hypothetical protein
VTCGPQHLDCLTFHHLDVFHLSGQPILTAIEMRSAGIRGQAKLLGRACPSDGMVVADGVVTMGFTSCSLLQGVPKAFGQRY